MFMISPLFLVLMYKVCQHSNTLMLGRQYSYPQQFNIHFTTSSCYLRKPPASITMQWSETRAFLYYRLSGGWEIDAGGSAELLAGGGASARRYYRPGVIQNSDVFTA